MSTSLDLYPTIYSGFSKRIRIHLPDTGDSEDVKLKHTLRYFDLECVGHLKYSISVYRRDELMEALKTLYAGIWEEREYRLEKERIICHDACQQAAGTECTCQCGDRYHGTYAEGVSIGNDWDKNVGVRIVYEDKQIQIISRWHEGWTFGPTLSYLNNEN